MAANDPWIEAAAQDAGVRERLVASAGCSFSKVGFDRTTLAEVSNALGFSKSYFYKFFTSKQEIADAVCAHCLTKILTWVDENVKREQTAIGMLRVMLESIPAMGLRLLKEDENLFGVATISAACEWTSFVHYKDSLRSMLSIIILHGRNTGEFERKTPLDEVTRAILLAMHPLIDPRVLQDNLQFVSDGANDVIGLVLRSLAA